MAREVWVIEQQHVDRIRALHPTYPTKQHALSALKQYEKDMGYEIPQLSVVRYVPEDEK